MAAVGGLACPASQTQPLHLAAFPCLSILYWLLLPQPCVLPPTPWPWFTVSSDLLCYQPITIGRQLEASSAQGRSPVESRFPFCGLIQPSCHFHGPSSFLILLWVWPPHGWWVFPSLSALPFSWNYLAHSQFSVAQHPNYKNWKIIYRVS